MTNLQTRVFVTGANGFIGAHVCNRLQRRGYAVTRAVRTLPSDVIDARSVATGNLEDCDRLEALVARHDVVVHLAGRAHVMQEKAARQREEFCRSNVDATARLARASAAAAVRRFVMVSSVGVLGHRSDRPLTEADPPAPTGIYAESKLRAEQALAQVAQAASMETVVLRPTVVYGPQCPGNMARLTRLVALGLPLPLAGLTEKRSLLGIDNLSGLIEAAVTHPSAANQTFLAADGDDVSVPEIVRHLAAGLDVPLRLFPLPAGLVSLAAGLLGQRAAFNKLTVALRVDVSKAQTLLGWSPEVPVASGLRAVGRSFR